MKKFIATANELDQAVQILEQKNRIIIISSLSENYNIALTKKKKETGVGYVAENKYILKNCEIIGESVIIQSRITIKNELFTKAFDALSNQPIDNKLKEQIRESERDKTREY